MDCQDAQQHGLQGAGWTGRSASHGTPGAGGYERDLEGHPPEKRSERGRSPRGAEQGPAPAMFSPSPVFRQEKQLPLSTLVLETEESESDTSGEPGDRPGPKEDPPHLVARLPSDLEGDREGAMPAQEEVMGAEPSTHLELAILNGLDIFLTPIPPLLLSTGASNSWEDAVANITATGATR